MKKRDQWILTALFAIAGIILFSRISYREFYKKHELFLYRIQEQRYDEGFAAGIVAAAKHVPTNCMVDWEAVRKENKKPPPFMKEIK